MVQELTWNSIAFLLLAARWTLGLSLIGMVGGALGGLILATLSVSQSAIVRALVHGFIQAIQGIPLLMLLFLTYFGLGLLSVRLDPAFAVSAALVLYATVFLGDIWSGSIRTVNKGQWEAADSLALSRGDTLRYIVLPQAVRIAIPPSIGFIVQLIKGTSLASLVGFVELTKSAQMLNNVTYQPFVIYLFVAGIYFSMCWPISMVSRVLERKLSAPYKRSQET